jgi:hypothetical protein
VHQDVGRLRGPPRRRAAHEVRHGPDRRPYPARATLDQADRDLGTERHPRRGRASAHANGPGEQSEASRSASRGRNPRAER